MIEQLPSGLAKRIAKAILIALLAIAPGVCRADTVASLLGNFTINQYCGLRFVDSAIEVRYTVVFGQLPALRELHVADTDGDGVTSEAERNAYAEQLSSGFADQLKLTADGVAIPLRTTRWTTSLPTEQGGFSLRLDVDFTGALPASTGNANRILAFANENYPGRFGWQEIAVAPSRSIAVFDTNAFSTSLTAGLTESLQQMPATGPLAERAVQMTITRGAVPAGAQALQPRPGMTSAADATERQGSADATTSWIVRETRRIVDLISATNVPLHIGMLALLLAAVLGAFHAFSPGHGKTVVGAYLIGSRATPRHAIFLGATVTVTHTLGVFALGFATLLASRYIVPERLFPILSLVSGLIVLGMGIVLLGQRWRGARSALSDRQAHRYRQIARVLPATMSTRLHHHHDGASMHSHGGTMHTHSHGGSMHSHLPPGASGERVTWRSLLALGISGGLVPCPSAMVLLLAAVALNKTAYGLLLVLAFSGGLACALTAVGLTFLYARNRLGRPRSGARWPHLLPVASAGVITLVGVAMCYGAIATAPF